MGGSYDHVVYVIAIFTSFIHYDRGVATGAVEDNTLHGHCLHGTHQHIDHRPRVDVVATVDPTPLTVNRVICIYKHFNGVRLEGVGIGGELRIIGELDDGGGTVGLKVGFVEFVGVGQGEVGFAGQAVADVVDAAGLEGGLGGEVDADGVVLAWEEVAGVEGVEFVGRHGVAEHPSGDFGEQSLVCGGIVFELIELGFDEGAFCIDAWRHGHLHTTDAPRIALLVRGDCAAGCETHQHHVA